MLKKISRYLFNNLLLLNRKFCDTIPDDEYIKYMYKLWTIDPKNVHEAWDKYFKNIHSADNKTIPTKTLKDVSQLKKDVPQPKKDLTQPKKVGNVSQVFDLKIVSNVQKNTNQPKVLLSKVTDHSNDIYKENKSKKISPLEYTQQKAQEKCKQTEIFNFSTIEIVESPKYEISNKSLVYKQDSTTVTDCKEDEWVFLLCRKYPNYGHFLAKVNPLHFPKYGDLLSKRQTAIADQLKNLEEKIPADQECNLSTITYIGGFSLTLPFSEIIKRLNNIYTGTLGIQTRQTNRLALKKWIQRKVEYPVQNEKITALEKLIALKRLTNASKFDKFMDEKWPEEKRYLLRGFDILIPALSQIIDTSSTLGVNQVIIGMEHRGRLNVIANVLKLQFNLIFALFENSQGNLTMGTTNQFLNLTSEKHVRVSIVPTSSHAEYVGSIVMGKAKAQIFQKNDSLGKRVLPIIIHEDSSFSGQGICFETVRFDQLPLYTPFGTIHVVINDQMGSSSLSAAVRSTIYNSAVAHVNEAPVFHVNGEDVENVLYAAKLSAEIRQRFQADVILDIVGYSQDTEDSVISKMVPLMYSQIVQKKPVLNQFYEKLLKEKVVTETEYEAYATAFDKRLNEGYEKKTNEKSRIDVWIESPWKSFFQGTNFFSCDSTGIHEQTIYSTGNKLSELPRKYDLHPQVIYALKKRKELIKDRQLDWVLAEGIAFGSLLKMGIPVRLSGSQVIIGTFHQRHHILYHQTKEKGEYHPLSNIYPDQAEYYIINSPECINGPLAYEVGYSTLNPKHLIVWEAAYGDVVNYAQTVIDNFIASGEAKWRRQSGIVILLPHGMEGEDAEHSNARPERFLCLCNDDFELLESNIDNPDFKMIQLFECNIIIANCTTPANYFHILRRQILLPFRKPLILFTPKSMLNNSLLRSSFEEIIYPTEFKRIITDFDELTSQDQFDNIKKLLFCSGLVYYDLMEEREMRNLNEEIAIIRIEQLCPFPYDLITQELKKFKNVKKFAWVQEEHRNHGPWYYVEPRLQYCGIENLEYIGRLASAVTAAAYESRFIAERNAYLMNAMEI